MAMQTIALASTQVLQPIWGRATAQPLALTPHKKTDAVDHVFLPCTTPASVASAAAPAHTPQKGHLLRAASPLLEEMLESPVTACKPAQEAATGSPERHALYQDMLRSSNSSHQQSLPSHLPCDMPPNGRHSEGSRQRLSPPGSGAGTERRRQGQSPDKQAGSSCSMSDHATNALGVIDVVGVKTSLDLSWHGANAHTDAAAVSSRSASHHDGAVAGSAAHCYSDAIACASSAKISLQCPPSHAHGSTGGKMAVTASKRFEGPVAEDRAHQDRAQQQPGKQMLSNYSLWHTLTSGS